MRKMAAVVCPLILGQWKVYTGLLLNLIVDLSLTFSFAWFLGQMTDAAVQGSFERMGQLVPYGAVFVLLSVGSAYSSEYLDCIAVEGAKRELKNRLYKQALYLPATLLSKAQSGQILSHFTHDLDYIGGVLGSNLMKLIKLPLMSLGVFMYLFWLSPELSALALAAAPVAVIGGAAAGRLLRRNSAKIHQLAGDNHSLLTETLWGMNVIRSFNVESFFQARHEKENKYRFALELRDAKLRGGFHAGGDALGSFMFVASLGLGAYLVAGDRLSVGSLLTFVNLTSHLVYPLTGLAGLWAGVQRSISAGERLACFLKQPIPSADSPAQTLAPPFQQGLELREITFGYDAGRYVFDRFSLHISAGQTTAIVGASGAGKSTLFHLLQGFYKPESGRIFIDGRSVETMDSAELRALFAYVSQETVLFSGTVRDNLLLAKSDAAEQEMVAAATAANIHAFVMSLPDGYDTLLGERGLSLSGGQRQRLAIARALLKDAPILLLDEATSALDSHAERTVQEALARLMEGRTIVVIAHRLSTVQQADRIVVLDKGRIVQSGCHEELVVRQGLYRDLVWLQNGGGREASAPVIHSGIV